jgi:hypothetical protein
LRGIAIGRRNYLFASADSGGERAAAIYSLIGTAKLDAVAPEAWLRHVLAHIADHQVLIALTSYCLRDARGQVCQLLIFELFDWVLPARDFLPVATQWLQRSKDVGQRVSLR